METLLKQSQEILREAAAIYRPYAVVVMVSGGDDSLTAATVARLLIGAKVDYVLHGITRTGVASTTEHVREFAANYGADYIEADAGGAYEQYVLRKGFFGIGHTAHLYAYHILKHQRFRSALSRHIRQGKRGRNILLINGARRKESSNRKQNMIAPIRADGPNIWVNIINDWSKRDCQDLLQEEKVSRCPAAIYCHRSGECMCGTMQRKEEAEEIAYWLPEWGQWWLDIRARVRAAGFSWDWGEDVPPSFKAAKQREKQIAAGQMGFDWLPMCTSCQSSYAE